jgi:hypothetical protein
MRKKKTSSTVRVPPKRDRDGKIIRKGYSYKR